MSRLSEKQKASLRLLLEPELKSISPSARKQMRADLIAVTRGWLARMTGHDLAAAVGEVLPGIGVIALAAALSREKRPARRHFSLFALSMAMHLEQHPPWIALLGRYPEMFALCVVCDLDRMTYDEYAVATSVSINAFGGPTGVQRASQAMRALVLANGRPQGQDKNRDKGQISRSACRRIAIDYLIRHPSAADPEIVSHVRKVMADREGLRTYTVGTLKKKEYLGSLRQLRKEAREQAKRPSVRHGYL